MKAQAECAACRATGLYSGMRERDGSLAVVCHPCGGSGEVTVTWEPFRGRLRLDGVERVLQVNPGIMANTEGCFGGMPADDWYDGKPFPPGSEMREFVCPAWWYQSADSKRKPEWEECGFGRFSECKHFLTKADCWARFDRELEP